MKANEALFATPESVTNRPNLLAQSNAIATERPRSGNRAVSVVLSLLVALSLAFTAGYVFGVRETNDYFQETSK